MPTKRRVAHQWVSDLGKYLDSNIFMHDLGGFWVGVIVMYGLMWLRELFF